MSTNYSDPNHNGTENKKDQNGSSPPAWEAGETLANSVKKRLVDPEGLLALAREMGKLLGVFRPLEGYNPEGPKKEPALSENLSRALGARTLSEYFLFTLKSFQIPADDNPRLPILPRGPDSIGSALVAVKNLILAYQRAEESDPVGNANGKYTRFKVDLIKIQNALLKAERLTPLLQEMANGWVNEADSKFKLAKSLKERVSNILQAPCSDSPDELPDNLAMLAYTTTLAERIAESSLVFGSREDWLKKIQKFERELEIALSQVGVDNQRDWATIIQNVRARHAELEREHADLTNERLESDRKLKTALTNLMDAERRYLGNAHLDFRESVEDALKNVEFQLKGVLYSRRELAEFWKVSPKLLGKPVFLERIFLVSAMNLALAQGILEDTRHRLIGKSRELSSTQKVRFQAETSLNAINSQKESTHLLEKCGRLIASLASMVSVFLDSERSRELLQRALDRSERIAKESAQEIQELKESFARQILEVKDGNTKDLAEMAHRFRAVLNEKDRLTERLLEAQENLSQSGEIKGKLLKTVSRAKEKLTQLTSERRAILSALNEAESNLDTLRRRHKRLSLIYVHEQKKLKNLEAKNTANDGELANYQTQIRASQEEKEDLTRVIAQYKEEITKIKEDRGELDKFILELKKDLEEAKNRENTFAIKLAAKEEELNETTKIRAQLSEVVSNYRLYLDRVAVAHEALKKSWIKRGNLLAEANLAREAMEIKLERKQEELIEKVTQLQETKTDLSELSQRVSLLTDEREKLLEDLEREALRARDAEDAYAKVAEELATLQEKSTADLTPVVAILGYALYESTKDSKNAEETLQNTLNELKFIHGADLAGVRIGSAARELEYIEALDNLDRELVVAHQENAALKEENLHLKEFQPVVSEASKESENLLQFLGWVLSGEIKKREQVEANLAEYQKKDLGAQREAENAERVLKDLIQSRDLALSQNQAKIAGMQDLINFFLSQGQAFWFFGPEADYREALIFLMFKENQNLFSELEKVKSEKQELLNDRATLLIQIDLMRERLLTYGPVLDFLFRAFQENALEMARVQAVKDLTGTYYEGPSGNLAFSPEEDLVRQSERLLAEKARLSKENESLANTASRQAEELAAQRLQQKELGEELEELKGALQAKDGELVSLQETVTNLSENPPPRWQAETLWAALNYVAVRANGAVARLENRLRDQAQEIEETFGELQKRDERIKTLENQQDKLSVLYWTLIAMASKGIALPTLPQDGGGNENSGGSQGTQTGSPAAGNTNGNTNEGGVGAKSSFLARAFLRDLRDAARKSLFSLALVGSLCLVTNPTAQAKSGDWQTLKSQGGFSPYHGEYRGMHKPPEYPELPDREITFIASRMYCKTLGRSVDLSFLPPEARYDPATQAEARARELLKSQAKKRELTLEEYLYLIREAYSPEQGIYLNDLDSLRASANLLKPHLPEIAKTLSRNPQTPSWAWNFSLKNAVRFKGPEGLFWDRLYQNFKTILGSETLGAQGAILHLNRKNRLTLPLVEYVGSLTPISYLEDLSPQKAVEFLVTFVRETWSGQKRRLPGPKPLALWATDLYNASHIFRVPLTFLLLASTIHFESRAPWPETLDIYQGTLKLVGIVNRCSRLWDLQKPYLCDLDEVVAYLPVTQRDSRIFYQKKDILLQFCRRFNSQPVSTPPPLFKV
ncbi:MAG: hypothetical protein LBF22_09080 [Deltaproteobacteria bacterium]|nr:hypothetical protein [Deltaproteobacteria bacterium]